MKIKNWTLIEESAGGSKLPVGGYVIRILDVEDVPSREYLRITYDIAEGEHAGHYSDAFGKQNAWSHQFVRSYKDTAEGMFKAFLKRLEESNVGFNIEAWQARGCNEREFVGLEVGIVLQTEQYTNNKGEDKERLEMVGVYASQDIRNGDFKLPEPKDNRLKDQYEGAPAVSYGDDLPF